MSVNNPYSAPSADLDIKSTEKSLDKIKQFPRFSTWAVIGLTMITLGLYGYYWLFSRTKILNSLLPNKPIASSLIIITLIILLLNLVLTLFIPVLPTMEFVNPKIIATIYLLSIPVSFVAVILFLIWAFSFRNRFNILSESSKGSKFWLGIILTFFLNVYYFQYKINQIHDET